MYDPKAHYDEWGNPIRYSPDGYILPSAGQAKDDAVKARVLAEQQAQDRQGEQNTPIAGHDPVRKEQEADARARSR